MTKKRIFSALAMETVFMLGLFASGALAATNVFSESWNNCTAGWTVSGNGATCPSVGVPGPSLNLDPDAAGVSVKRSLSTVGFATYDISFWFMGSGLDSDTDSQFRADFSNGEYVILGVTEGVSPNNGYTLCTKAHGCLTNFASWPLANSWNEVTITVNTVLGTASASTPQGGSGSIAFTAGVGTSITRAEFSGIEWTPRTPTTYTYDELSIVGI